MLAGSERVKIPRSDRVMSVEGQMDHGIQSRSVPGAHFLPSLECRVLRLCNAESEFRADYLHVLNHESVQAVRGRGGEGSCPVFTSRQLLSVHSDWMFGTPLIR